MHPIYHFISFPLPVVSLSNSHLGSWLFIEGVCWAKSAHVCVCVCVCVGSCACFGSSGRVVGQGWEVSTVLPADVLAAYASDKLPSEGSQLSIP